LLGLRKTTEKKKIIIIIINYKIQVKNGKKQYRFRRFMQGSYKQHYLYLKMFLCAWFESKTTLKKITIIKIKNYKIEVKNG
jgi:hypothetical protein